MLPRKKTEYAHHPTIIWEISQVIVSLLVEEKTIYFGFAHKRDGKKTTQQGHNGFPREVFVALEPHQA